MNRKHNYCLLGFISLCSIGCGIEGKKEIKADSVLAPVKPDTLERNSVELVETFNREDVSANDYLLERLKPIRANFKRINSTPNSKWSLVLKKNLSETTESGEATFYYCNQHLERITARYFGENFQQFNEFYLLNGQISFVLERYCKYNRPLFYDSTKMKENNDIEVFDFEKAEVIEARSYFENEKLLHQLNNQDCGSPFTNEYLSVEEKRIKEGFAVLIKLADTK